MIKEEFKALEKDREDLLLLDIREDEELSADTKVEGSTHMPMGKVFTETAKDNLPKDKKIIVFCRSGSRAEIVARELRAKGYDVEGLEGGLSELNG